MIVYELAPHFEDRTDAGIKLSEALKPLNLENPVVLAIPRGGVPVAVEVADALGSLLDVIVTRKIQIPFNPEAGYGAVTEDGEVVLNRPIVSQLQLTDGQIQAQAEQVRREISRRGSVFHSKLSSVPLKERTAIIIDDGLASGYTMLAALKSARRRGAWQAVVAVPTASETAYNLVQSDADNVISLLIARTGAFAVASFYYDWYDLSDEEVMQYLDDWNRRGAR